MTCMSSLRVSADTQPLDHDMICVVVVNVMAKISFSTVGGGFWNVVDG